MKARFIQIVSSLEANPTLWVSTSIFILFLTTRLYNIFGVPIFNDEAIYLHWSQLLEKDWHNLFISLTDGKQPSFIWVEAVMLHLFSDPLLAGRMVSVIAGLASLVGIYFLTKELFKNKQTAFIASLLYVLYPYSLLYDRMALYDSMVAMFAIWSLYLEILLIRRRETRVAVFAAIVIGGGLLTKSSALFFVLLLPFSLMLFDFSRKNRKKELTRWFILALATTLGAFAIQSIMRLSSHFAVIDYKNHEFTLTIDQWLQSPVHYFTKNGIELIGFVVGYSTVSLILVAALAVFIDKKYIKEKIILLTWIVLPFIVFACLAKLRYPRYILFMMMPILPLAAYSINCILSKTKIKLVAVIAILALFLPMLVKDYMIITDFANAPIPHKDRDAYIESYPSGVGVNETIKILEEKSKNQKIYVGVQGSFGIMPYALQIYLKDNKNIEIQEFAGISPTPPPQVTDAIKRLPTSTYFLFRAPECDSCPEIGLPPPGWKVKQVMQIKRITPNSYFTLVQVLP